MDRAEPNSSLIEVTDEPCLKCGGDGYTESFNEDHTDVVVTLCTDCGPGAG